MAKTIISFLNIVLVLLLISCSGGETGTGLTDNQTDSNDSASEPKTNVSAISIGTVTRKDYANLTVNGKQFATGNSSIIVGNTVGSESDLAVGMVVAVNNSVDDDNETGTTNVIEFENEVEGIVLANDYPNSLNVMGQVVIINNDTVFESHVSGIASLEDIRKKDHVEVSGFPTQDGSIFATRIVVKPDDSSDNKIIVKGVVTSVSGADLEFNLGELTVAYDESVYTGDITALQPGAFVRVIGHSGYRGLRNEILFADEIKPIAEPDTDLIGTAIEIEGIVTSGLSDDYFELARFGVLLKDDAQLLDGELTKIVEGKKLRVSGVISDESTISADQISFLEISRLKLKASIEAIDYLQNTLTLLGEKFLINENTIIKQDDHHASSSVFTLAHLSQGDFVKAKAYFNSESAMYVTTSLELENHEEVIKLEGRIDDIQSGVLSIQSFKVDISNLPPGQFMERHIGRKIELILEYVGETNTLVATRFEYED